MPFMFHLLLFTACDWPNRLYVIMQHLEDSDMCSSAKWRRKVYFWVLVDLLVNLHNIKLGELTKGVC